MALELVVVLRPGERLGERTKGLFERAEGQAGRFAGSTGGEKENCRDDENGDARHR